MFTSFDIFDYFAILQNQGDQIDQGATRKRRRKRKNKMQLNSMIDIQFTFACQLNDIKFSYMLYNIYNLYVYVVYICLFKHIIYIYYKSKYLLL